MAGIYLHIPFCKKACHYCDFHFSTSLNYKDELLACMHNEIQLQKNYLQNAEVETIYFGGGTPSFIGVEELSKLIGSITKHFNVKSDAEITVEANPDDLDAETVRALRHTEINRFSIGIQSFFEEDLLWMNRAHHAAEAESSVKRVQDGGFENISADLIYGFPLLSDNKWSSNIGKIISMQIPHVSAYSMTVEPKTALASFISKGKQQGMNDSQSAEHYLSLIETLGLAGFEHYETSNFAMPDLYSKHNTNYWKGIHYLGIGPSAHSFNGISRQWNIANNSGYIKEIVKGIVPYELELLTKENRVNEYIMTSLRTVWGMDLSKIEREFGLYYKDEIQKNLSSFLEKQQIVMDDNVVKLSRSGKLFADKIASELFITSDILQ